MNQFAKVATNGNTWRRTLSLANTFAPLAKPFAPLIPGLKNWVAYREFPTLSGNLHKKVSNMKGVIYE